MKCYSISYDLRNPGRDYSTLISTLDQWGAVKPLRSDWLLRSDATAVQIRDALASLVDANDGVFVATLTGEAAWRKVLCADAALKAELNG